MNKYEEEMDVCGRYEKTVVQDGVQSPEKKSIARSSAASKVTNG